MADDGRGHEARDVVADSVEVTSTAETMLPVTVIAARFAASPTFTVVALPSETVMFSASPSDLPSTLACSW